MAKGVVIGDDSLLTQELADNDRITITKAANGQTVATMTVADFMQKCADMLPVATTKGGGAMSAQDRVSYPAGNQTTHFSNFFSVTSGTKVRVSFDHDLNATTMVVTRLIGSWYNNNANGIIFKRRISNGNGIANDENKVLEAWDRTASVFYVSDMGYDSESGTGYIEVINKSPAAEMCLIEVDITGMFATKFITSSVLDSTADERALSNMNEM